MIKDDVFCKKCGKKINFTSTYTDKRSGIKYDQWWCPDCKVKRTTRNGVVDIEKPEKKELVDDEKVTMREEKDGTKSLFGFVGSIDELLSRAGVDTNVWEVASWEIDTGKWEVPMNIRTGPNNDRKSVPHKETARKFRIRARLVARKGIINRDRFREELIADVRKSAPKVHKLVRKNVNSDDPHLMLVNLYDLHLDKVAWHEETGTNWNVKIASELAKEAVSGLINRAKGFYIDRILLPVGHDFFNSDYSSPYPRTTAGTPQESDSRYQDIFRKGRILWTEIINMLREVADVDVELVPGNHDEERSFFLVDALGCFYHNDENVNVSECPKVRKYYSYGDNLIGLTHGKDLKAKDFPMIMPLEVPNQWSESMFRYWKLGHLHHKKVFMMLSSEDMMGVNVEFLPSLTPTDAWHFKKGFIGSPRRATADLFSHKGEGQVATFSFTAK